MLPSIQLVNDIRTFHPLFLVHISVKLLPNNILFKSNHSKNACPPPHPRNHLLQNPPHIFTTQELFNKRYGQS